MAGKLFKKNFKTTFLSKNDKDKEDDNVTTITGGTKKSHFKSVTPTPLPLKQSIRASSASSLYASTPALTTTNETLTSTQTTNSRFKTVRNFFRNRFNLNNKTANKQQQQQQQMTQSTIQPKTTTNNVSELVIDDLSTKQQDKTAKISNLKSKQQKTNEQENLKLITANLKERLIKSKINDKNNLIDATNVSDDEGISKTPDSLKIFKYTKKINTNINKNSSFGYSSESFASIGSIDSNNLNETNNNNQIDSLKTSKTTSLVDNSMLKAKIHAAAYRNNRKTINKKRLENNFNNNDDQLINSFIMDPIEETTKRDDSYDSTNLNENNNNNNNNNDNDDDDGDKIQNNKDAFKKILSQQIKQQLNKSNPQLDKTDTKADTITQLPPPGPNDLLEKHKNNLRSIKLKDQQIQLQQQITNEFKLIKRNNSIKNQQSDNNNNNNIKRNNSMDLNLIDSTTTTTPTNNNNIINEGSKRSSFILNNSLTKSEDPIYDNLILSRQASSSRKSIDKRSSIDSLNSNKNIEYDSLEKDLNEEQKQQEPVLFNRKSIIESKKRANTTNITSNIDVNNNSNQNVSKLGHSKSFKFIDTNNIYNTDSNSLISPSANDISKNFSIKTENDNNNKSTTNGGEPVWREIALKKQSAWKEHENDNNKNRANSCMPVLDSSIQNEDKIQQAATRVGKVKSLINNIEK